MNCTASGLDVTSTTPIWITQHFNHVSISFILNIHLQFHECTTFACLFHFQAKLLTMPKIANQTTQCYPCILSRGFETTCQRLCGLLQIKAFLCHIHGITNHWSILCSHLWREKSGMGRRNRKSTRDWSIRNMPRFAFNLAISFNQCMCMFHAVHHKQLLIHSLLQQHAFFSKIQACPQCAFSPKCKLSLNSFCKLRISTSDIQPSSPRMKTSSTCRSRAPLSLHFKMQGCPGHIQ